MGVDNNINNRKKKVDPRLITRSKREELERKKELREKARKKLRTRRLIASFFILIFTLVAFGGCSVVSFVSNLKTDNLIDGIAPASNEPINILILGMDMGDLEQEDNESLKRTDTMMVLNYNPSTKKINIVSIPRDTLIEVDAYDGDGNLIPYWKINTAYVLGGEKEVIYHVENILDIKINYLVEIGYNAFRNLIDAIGPIEMYIEQDMYYDDDAQDLHINFKKGETVLLDGEKAEEFFRWRHNNDGSGGELGDLGRIQNQQKFIAKVIDKVMSPTIIFKVPKILDVIQKNVSTNMPGNKMISYGLKFLGNDGIAMTTLQGYDETIYGQDFLVVDKDMNREILDTLKSGQISNSSISRADYRILVLNGTRINGLAGDLQTDLINIGYSLIDVGNEAKRETSAIICDDKNLKEQLKIDTGITKFEKNIKEEYSQYDAVIILGEDFSTFGD